MHANMHVLHLLVPKIRDDSNGEADDGEHSANVRHPSEGKGFWRRDSSRRARGAEVLGKEESSEKLSAFKLIRGCQKRINVRI